MGLTLKQRAFVDAYMKCKNAAEAYCQVYSNKADRKTAARAAFRLLENPKVQDELAGRKERLDKVSAITVQSIVAEQENAMEMAKAGNNAVAYAAASMNKAKLLGMLIERQAVLTAKVDMTELAPDLSSIWGKAKLKLLPHAVTPTEPVIEIASDYKDIED